MERAVALCRLDEITVDDLPVQRFRSINSSKMVITTESPGELITLGMKWRAALRAPSHSVRSAATRPMRRAS